MALCATVDDPEHRFACGVAKYGDCDIVTSWAQGDREGRLDLERMMGAPADAREAYRAGSPIHRIEQLAVPLLIAHGEQDERVHPAQSVELVDALRRLGKAFEYVTYPTEAHGLLRAGPLPALPPPVGALPRLASHVSAASRHGFAKFHCGGKNRTPRTD